jgi:hypothetical protein
MIYVRGGQYFKGWWDGYRLNVSKGEAQTVLIKQKGVKNVSCIKVSLFFFTKKYQ